jgi:hypothetical protein
MVSAQNVLPVLFGVHNQTHAFMFVDKIQSIIVQLVHASVFQDMDFKMANAKFVLITTSLVTDTV